MAGTIEMATLLWKGKFDSSGLNLGLNNAQKQVDGLHGKFGGLNNFMSKTLFGSLLGLSGSLTAMGAAGIKSAMDLQNQMNQFRADTGMSAEETEKVKKAVKDMFVSTGKSYSDLSAMATTMHNKLGMGADDIEKYGTGWVKFAKVTKQSNDEAITGIAGIRNAWHLSNDQIQGVLDELIVSNQKYGLTVQESEQSLRSLAPAFSAAHMSINQGIAYLDLFKKAGLDSSNATIAFNTALRKVKSPEELQNIITKMQNTKDDSERAKIAMEVFGKQGLTMAAALKPGTQSLEDIKKSLENASGATDRASKVMGGTLTAQLAKLKRTSLDLLEGVGEKALPTIQGFVDYVQAHMPQIQNTMGKAFNVAGQAVGILGNGIKLVIDHSNILIPVLAGIVGMLGAMKVIGVVNGLIATWNAVTKAGTIAQWAMNVALDANPIGIIIIAVGALITIGAALAMHWKEITKAAGELWKNISGFFENIGTKIKDTWNNAKNDASNSWNNIKNTVKEGCSTIADKVKEHGGGIKGVLLTEWDIYTGIYKKGYDTLNNLTGGRLGNIVDCVKNKLQDIHNTISGWKQKLADAWAKIWNFKLPHIDLPHFSIKGKFSLSPPSIPSIGVNWYAQGGIFNQPAIVGVGDAPGGEAVLPINKLNDILYNTMDKLGYSNNYADKGINPSDNKNINITFMIDKMVANEQNAKEFAKVYGNELMSYINR